MNDLGVAALYDIMQLRQEIFVVEQKCVYLDADGLDMEAYHFLGRDENNDIISYLRIVPPSSVDNFVRIGRVLVRLDSRGQGVASELMAEALKRIKVIYPGQPIKLSAQIYLEKFYASMGFAKISDTYDEDGIEHVDMVREAGSEKDGRTVASEEGGCLSPELMNSFVERRCTEAEKQRCLEHIRECKSCYATYLALMMSGLKDAEQGKKGRVVYVMNYPVNLNALALALILVVAGFAALFLL